MAPQSHKKPLEPQQGSANPAPHGENTVDAFHSGTAPTLRQLVQTVGRNSGESGFVFYEGMLRGKGSHFQSTHPTIPFFLLAQPIKVHVGRLLTWR